MVLKAVRRAGLLAAGMVLVAPFGGCGDGNTDSFLWGRTPSFTPDGVRLLYSQNLSTPSDQTSTTVSALDAGVIWRIDLTGLNPFKVTPDGRGPDFFPKVSPDGTKVAFISGEGDQFNVWVSDLDGGNRRQLTFDQAIETTPCWSPDNSKIAFASTRGGNHDLWQVRLDGSGLEQLTSLASDEASPAYSPDGSTIAFAANSDRGNFDLWLMDAAGGNLRQLTRKDEPTSPLSDGGPDWSPDGSTLVFERWDGSWDIWSIGADGTGLTRLTNEEGHDGDPTYSPDGQTIAFSSSRTGWWQVWLMHRDGTAQRQLTGVAQ